MPWHSFRAMCKISHSDHFTATWMRVKWNFHQISITMEKLLMKWAPGSSQYSCVPSKHDKKNSLFHVVFQSLRWYRYILNSKQKPIPCLSGNFRVCIVSIAILEKNNRVLKKVYKPYGKDVSVTLIRDHFLYAPSQWETTLQCNVVSYWLGPYSKWSLFDNYWSFAMACHWFCNRLPCKTLLTYTLLHCNE